jgi:hypothetical protein
MNGLGKDRAFDIYRLQIKAWCCRIFELRIQVQCEPERAMLRAFGVYIVRGSAVELGGAGHKKHRGC